MVGSASATKDPEDTLHTSGLRWLGLAVGAIAFLLALLAPGTLSAIPLSGLAINIALLAGLLCLFLVLFEGHGPWFGDRLLAVLFPVLAAAVLARLFVMDPGTSQAIVLRESGGYEVGSVALALLAIRGLERGLGWCAGRAFWAVGIGGGATAGLLLARHAQLAWPMVPGAGTILLLTAALVVAALVLQSTLARRSR
ncbi:MAG: hypothetical protein R3185_05060, partial [Candidatus Thermoplasmatota archaeon]|nr:hypothetical protein [Candidatus Thermoplasmatota archaeon]